MKQIRNGLLSFMEMNVYVCVSERERERKKKGKCCLSQVSDSFLSNE